MYLRHLKQIFISLITVLAIGGVILLYRADFGQDKEIEFGVTFSQKYALELNLDWRQTMLAMLNDLTVRDFRLIGYWDILEPEEGKYQFADLDWQINEVAKRGGKIILALGHRVPRWPECHWPAWIYRLSNEERQERALKLIEAVMTRYRGNEAIISWQIDNEPFLKTFGECPRLTKQDYEQEVILAKSLDKRPIVVTESGELSTWLNGGKFGDQIGTSVYRVTWNKYFGYFYYPLPPAHYYLKAKLVQWFTGVTKVFVSELQMEPWLGRPVLLTSLEDQAKAMDLARFKDNLAYSRRIGLSPVYLWGAEWWYWLKQQGDSAIWNEAKQIWAEQNN